MLNICKMFRLLLCVGINKELQQTEYCRPISENNKIFLKSNFQKGQ